MKEFNSSSEVNGTAFDIASLSKLERLIREDSETGLSISRIKLSYDEGNVELNSFDELTEDDTESFTLNPYHIDITAHGRREKENPKSKFDSAEIWKSAHIDIWKDNAKLRVSGKDRTWVLGKQATLLEHLKGQRKRNYSEIALSVLSVGIFAFLFSYIVRRADDDPLLAIIAWVFGTALLILTQVSYYRRKPSGIRLKKENRRNPDLTLIFTVVGILVAIAIAIFDN